MVPEDDFLIRHLALIERICSNPLRAHKHVILKQKPMKKHIGYLASVLAIVVLAGAGCTDTDYTYPEPTTTPGTPTTTTNNPPTTTPETTSLTYKNTAYGFSVELPQTWKGYKIITEKWEGFVFNKDQTQNIKSTEGPKLSIRHPKWTAQVKRQDIPVLVFTIKQWDDLQAGTIHLDTAAPVLPSELARNTKYVFALPARYNFAFPEGNEEVDQLIQNKAVKAL
jgi:hypothetical protein